jgi:hypothetical protein
MKRILTTLTFILISFASFSQITDSVNMGIGNAVDVYYNLKTGKKDTVSNRNWHLAFAVRNAQPPTKTMQSATILINEGRGVSLYETNKTLEDWNSFDTTNWKTWKQSFNSDSTWDLGAFNVSRNVKEQFDYGWGTYNMNSKAVSGDKIFLLAIDGAFPGAPSSNFRKICIQKIVFDSQWVFTISKLDGTDSNTVVINKKDFSGKLFAYYNFLTNTVIDREPVLAKDWNLLFTRYKTLVSQGPVTTMYPVMGVLQNGNTRAYRYAGANSNSVQCDTMMFSSDIRSIDWDWKVITTQPGEWPIVDSFAYFTAVGNVRHKIKFIKYYSGTDRQVVVFNKSELPNSVGKELRSSLNFTIFPNPASENITIDFNNQIRNNQITISDISGKVVFSETASGNQVINLSNIRQGLYFIEVANSNGSKIVKFIKQ